MDKNIDIILQFDAYLTNEVIMLGTDSGGHDCLTLKGWDEIKNGEGVAADEVFSYLNTWGTSDKISKTRKNEQKIYYKKNQIPQ